MKAVLDAPYVDARAADLSWRLLWDATRLPALGVRTIPLGGTRLELRLLGASHQVVIDDAWSETVACLPDSAGLPVAATRSRGELEYRFAARVETPPDFAAQVAALLDVAERDRYGLVGVFPGSPHAVTAIRAAARPGGVAWRTWHAYPRYGQIVVTTSEVRGG